MCKVSVILPSLNVAKYIRQCLDSVVGQTLSDIEILCVDAGSTDGTLEQIRAYAARDPRVRLILSEKKSYGHQMNLGIRAARGMYIGIVETDDYVPADMYEDLCRIAAREDAEIVKADFYRFREKGDRIERTYNRLDPSDTFYGKIVDPGKSPEVFRLIMNTWSGIYRRDFLLSHGIEHNETPGASYQDNGFWFRTFCCAQRIYFVDKPYYMNRRDNAESSVFNPGKIYCMSEEYADIYRWLKADPQRFSTFIGAFTLKKYHSLLTTYNRIAPEYRREYIAHFSGEMRSLIEAGEYDRSLFTAYEWKRLWQIIRQPDRYHFTRSAGCFHYPTARLCRSNSSVCRVIRELDHAMDSADIIFSWICLEGTRKTIRRIKWKNTSDSIKKEA